MFLIIIILQVPTLLAGQASAKAKQATLVALGALTSSHGKENSGAILTTLPSVLAQVCCLLTHKSAILHCTYNVLFLVSLPSIRLLIYSARKSEQDLPASALGTTLEGSCLHFA